MTMTLDPATERLLREIAGKTGMGTSEVLTTALTAHARATGVALPPTRSREERFNGMLAIARRAAQRPVLDPRSPDEIIGYNALGLPE